MKKKILGILVVSLLIATIILPVAGARTRGPIDIIDQSQENQTDKHYLSRWDHYAQSFKPEMSKLTRVELYLRHSGATHDIEVVIRSDLYGIDLTSDAVPATNVPINTWKWVEFDFPDIDVTPGNTYYIVATQISGGDLDVVAWGCSNTNIYFEGTGWSQAIWTDPYGPWEIMDNVDFCFRSYAERAKSRSASNSLLPFLSDFLEEHPNLFPILQKLLIRFGIQ